VVDEAQNLDLVVLEALRQLSNFETPDSKLVQVVLAGQPQLAEKLATSTHEQLRQRISAISRLRPLALEETQAYIHHRLATAGYNGSDLFTEAGVRLVWNHSKGVPRNINTLCFGAMMVGFAERAKEIDECILEEAARNLDLNSALADVFEMPRSLEALRGGNGKVHPDTPPETDDARGVASAEPLISAGSVSHESGRLAASARMDDRNTDGAHADVPAPVVEALARIARALEEQRLLLMAKSSESSQPLSEAPVIPLYCTAAEGPETPASLASPPRLLFSTAIERSTRAKQSFVSDPPAIADVAAKKNKSRIVGMKALSFVAFAGILVLMLLEKFPLHLRTVKAGVPGRSAAVEDGQPASYPVSTGLPASLIVRPSTPGANPATDLDPPRAPNSDRSRDVVIRRFSTDVSVTSKSPDNGQELTRIFFDENSDEIDSQYRPWLQQLAAELGKDPKVIVTLEGHTDGRGQESHNLHLSNRRAIAVRNVLVNELHVPQARLTATGVGSEAPLQPNSSAAGRAFNRRVEVRLAHSQ
jgi:outer membrane protein OmpA-like peptidoglycan-associated protein